MNNGPIEGHQFLHDLEDALKNTKIADDVDFAIAAPFVTIPFMINHSHGEEEKVFTLPLAAQNFYYEDKGAFTGEISLDMLDQLGIEYLIIGHSERRAYFNEDDTLLKKKVNQALRNDIEVIFCFGEELEDRKAEDHFKVVATQLTNALFHLKEENWKNIVLAYEPVWAIGTGMTASPEQAQEMHAFIRNLVKENYNEAVADNVSILYGGSVKPANAKEIFSKPDVDGGLIGGASLKATMFVGIIEAM